MTTATIKAEGRRQKAASPSGFDVAKVRADFPILSELVHGKPLVYLDSANTSQKPTSVLQAMDDYYRHANANIHRATHLLSERATALYEGGARQGGALPERARSAHHRADQGHDRRHQPGGAELRAIDAEARRRDPAVVAGAPLEHRAVAAGRRADRRRDRGRADQRAWRNRSGCTTQTLLSARTKIVAIGHVSNALGTINPIEEMIAQAHAHGAVVLIDGAQAAPHSRDRRAGARLRLLRVVEPQDVRPDRHRRALRPRERCSRRCRRIRAAAT